MRFGFVLLLIALPGAAFAAEDRYGPTRRVEPVPAAVQGSAAPAPAANVVYGGPTLSWNGKQAAATPLAAPAVAALPQPAPQAYASSAPRPASAPLPTSLYDAPAPTTATAAVGPVTPPAAVPPPAPVAQPQMAASNPNGYSQPRAYSLVREYGGTPDRIPGPPPQSAYRGAEVTLDPGLLGGNRDPDPPADDEQDEQQTIRKPVKSPK